MPKISNQSPVTSLSFVKTTRKDRAFWSVPRSKSYKKSCRRGRQYAIEFARFLEANPTMTGAGILPRIIEDMAKIRRGTKGHGHVAGFLAAIEKALQLIDVVI